MPYSLILKEEARLDITDAYQYYEQQQPGLGVRFLAELQKRAVTITEHPEYYSYIDSRHTLRDVTLDKFPFVIVFEISGHEVIIYAIHPTQMRPKNY